MMIPNILTTVTVKLVFHRINLSNSNIQNSLLNPLNELFQRYRRLSYMQTERSVKEILVSKYIEVRRKDFGFR